MSNMQIPSCNLRLSAWEHSQGWIRECRGYRCVHVCETLTGARGIEMCFWVWGPWWAITAWLGIWSLRQARTFVDRVVQEKTPCAGAPQAALCVFQNHEILAFTPVRESEPQYHYPRGPELAGSELKPLHFFQTSLCVCLPFTLFHCGE